MNPALIHKGRKRKVLVPASHAGPKSGEVRDRLNQRKVTSMAAALYQGNAELRRQSSS